jgi:hypothetical protein
LRDEDAGGLLRPEGDRPRRRARRVERHVEQAQELEERRFRDLVEAEEQVLAEEREQLDERDPRVARVEVGPLRRVDRDALHELVAELLVRAVVEDRLWKRHQLRANG